MDSWLNDLLNKLGIPPLFFGTLVMLVLSLFHTKDLKRWDELSKYKKRFIIMVWIAALVGLFASVIAFFSIHF